MDGLKLLWLWFVKLGSIPDISVINHKLLMVRLSMYFYRDSYEQCVLSKFYQNRPNSHWKLWALHVSVECKPPLDFGQGDMVKMKVSANAFSCFCILLWTQQGWNLHQSCHIIMCFKERIFPLSMHKNIMPADQTSTAVVWHWYFSNISGALKPEVPALGDHWLGLE